MACRSHPDRALVSAFFAAAFALGSGATRSDAETPPAMPSPQPFPIRADAPAANAACERCHADIAAEWRASYHAKADTDPVYRRALAREPLAFCRGCHAPEADAHLDAPADVAAIGVGCVTCHQTDHPGHDEVLAAPGLSKSTSPHPVLRDARFATAAACANCHEFSFPQVSDRHAPDKMQSTISEHVASPLASVGCATCHMPSVVDPKSGVAHRSHSFAGGHDEAFLRQSLTVAATRSTGTHVSLSLRSTAVGHAVPTGDLFRRLVVTAEAIGDDWTVIDDATKSLARRFAIRDVAPGKTTRVLVGDDRVEGTRTVDLDLGDAARDAPIVWRVDYQIVEHPIGTSDDAVVASTVTLASGTLDAVHLSKGSR